MSSRTTQASERVAATLGELNRAAVTTGLRSPPYGPASNVAPLTSGRMPTRKERSPLSASMDTAASVSPYAPAPAGPGVGSPVVAVRSAPFAR